MKTNKKISILIVSILILSISMIACNKLDKEGGIKDGNGDQIRNSPIVTYLKDNGLYYFNLTEANEIKIQEGNNFEYPLISKLGNYIAYSKGDNLYVYDIEKDSYDKIDDKIGHYYRAYDWIDDENLIYGSTEKSGLVLYNVKLKEKIQHLDEDFYTGLVVSKDKRLYASKIKQWKEEGNNYWLNQGIVEINLNSYDENKKEYSIEILVGSKETTEETIGTNPIVWNTSENGRYVYIMEKFASGSLSTDLIYLGLYDKEEKSYTVFEDIETLSYKNHLALNPHNNMIGLIQGAGREMIDNKEVVLLDIKDDKSYDIVNFMADDLVAMTPSFTLDGKKLLYSATKNPLDNEVDGYNSIYDQWDDQAHNIYEYDTESLEIRQITGGEDFDFLPVSISAEELIFISYNSDKKQYYIKSLIGYKEKIIAENIQFFGGKDNYPFGLYGHIDTEKAMDIFK